MASDLKLASDGDLDLTDGEGHLVSDSDEVVQAVKIRLRLVLGEWFLDTRLGVDYPGVAWVKNPDLTAVEALLRRTILETPGMGTLTSYTQTLTTATRTMAVTWAGTTDDGTPIEDSEVVGL